MFQPRDSRAISGDPRRCRWPFGPRAGVHCTGAVAHVVSRSSPILGGSEPREQIRGKPTPRRTDLVLVGQAAGLPILPSGAPLCEQVDCSVTLNMFRMGDDDGIEQLGSIRAALLAG
jgi:hypothetical protein